VGSVEDADPDAGLLPNSTMVGYCCCMCAIFAFNITLHPSALSSSFPYSQEAVPLCGTALRMFNKKG
jgi:hypothetical protein